MKKLHFALAFMAALTLAGCSGDASRNYGGKLVKQYGGEKTRPDPVAERFINLSHPQSGEKAQLVYFRNGAYDKQALAKINRLMRDRRADEIGKIDPELIDFLVDIRTRLALPRTIVFEILSGYRSPASNASLARTNGNVAKESQHMYGYAADFRISGVHGSAIAEIAKTMQRGGVSFYPKSNHVHVDIGNIRTWKTN
jgi:uncharacterized protein YcbK (DUF882 family)